MVQSLSQCRGATGRRGDGAALVVPNQPIVSPAFTLDGGYLTGKAGASARPGLALGTESSDHVSERGPAPVRFPLRKVLAAGAVRDVVARML